MYLDFREVLDRKDIDAVLIATGPNWHCLGGPCGSRGKDIYCEEPCTKNIVQSIALADIMKRTARIFQAGTQRRNLPTCVCLLVGVAESSQTHQGLRSSSRYASHVERLAPSPTRAGQGPGRLGYVSWAGRWRPFNEKHLDGFNFEKGGGLVGGGVLEWGSHCVDLCQWALVIVLHRSNMMLPRMTNWSRLTKTVANSSSAKRVGFHSALACPLRRRKRLGRSGGQRQDGFKLARVAGRPNR